MSSTITNASSFYYLRQNVRQLASPTNRSTVTHTVKFGSDKDYYRALDPKATEHEINEYSDAEDNWRNIIRHVEMAQGADIFGILRSKTYAEYRALETALRTNLGIDIDEHSPEEKESDAIDQHTLAHTTLRGNGRIVIHTYIDTQDPEKAHENFLTLAHEGIHAAHLKKQSIAPIRDEALVDDLDRLEDSLNGAVDHNSAPHNLAGWKQLFRQNATLVGDLRDAYDIDDLKKMKVHLKSEAVAYGRSAYLGKTLEDRNQELTREAGYKAAVSFINDLIDEQTITSHASSSHGLVPANPAPVQIAGEWRYDDDMRHKYFLYQQTGQWSQAVPTGRADSPSGWKYSINRDRAHYKHPGGQRTPWEPAAQ